ncbi:MAG: hypothetical protein A3B13_02825 [Candidatus Liptonbacteria bacterium RIFCSPLOWO2_01_FULL_45_15]|uniref:Lycopene cyclase domain-containing protein n=1 Tax=Candidatus Liptonbacteria bacterium RIFCSPLOWO2_01_FULL_45_15 TaxID=1798649 RepID=A0A1G2CHC1_9BACT|nr:MAG: hypothetical protein A3B13_02825 [Candidatus Liptonbacteria bacterium RIFCSPLOWO2_01_FULL_45_15]
MYFYLISATILLVTGIALEIIFREHLFKHLKARIFWALIYLAIGTIWDVYALAEQHWIFTGKGILGLYIGIIPLEEFLWYLIVPYFCLTVYKTAHVILDKRRILYR